jgi:tetratricopeptide (TPR) repeat protein
MSLTLLVWLFIACSIAISALIAFPLRLDAARFALLSRLRSWALWQNLRGTSRTLIVVAAVFLLVAGIGVVASYMGSPHEATGAGSLSHSGADGDVLARLKDYTRSIGTEEPVPKAAVGELLPDVNTMIERLAARLKTTPDDIKGWRMLAWSYFNTGHYRHAATTYARALELDPNSAELKLSYEAAKAKAAESNSSKTASALKTDAVGKGGHAPGLGDAAIRAMVDGLAHRLESSPRDVEGWTRLMRSRVVLGEREIAAAAFSKALEVFKDDSAASGKITSVAIELGLKAE